jgi:hypothetical protein
LTTLHFSDFSSFSGCCFEHGPRIAEEAHAGIALMMR